MNEQFNTPNSNVQSTDQNTNGPLANPDPFADKAPVNVAPIHVLPLGEVVYDSTRATPYDAPPAETMPTQAPVVKDTKPLTALLNHEQSEHFRTRWNEIQGQFVDEPRLAVQQADGLVSEVIQQITQMFASEHSVLEGQWKQGADVSTEDLRKALQHYRSFFNRLVV